MKTVPRNNPIATVFKHYIDKKSGNVTSARLEIKRRFFGLDWKDQKKILTAFLESGQTDRAWAYSRLLDMWDESFAPKIQALWEEHHESKCAWIIIRYFPTEYIKAHINALDEDRNYYFICRRLAEDESFVIDKDRLSKLDYLMALSHSNRKITDDEATDILFSIVCDICSERYASMELSGRYHPSRTEMMLASDFANVRMALYYLAMMGHAKVVFGFLEWQKNAQASAAQSEEYKTLIEKPLSDYEYKSELATIVQKHFYYTLSPKYKTMLDEEYDKSFEPTCMPLDDFDDSFLSLVASAIDDVGLSDISTASSGELFPF